MKKILYSIISGAIALGAASCTDMLNTVPSNQISSGSMWTTPELAASGMNGLYESFYKRINTGTQLNASYLDGFNFYGIEALGFCTDYYSNSYPV